MLLLFRQLEIFSSINLIGSIYYKSLPLMLPLGAIFVFLVLVLFLFFKKFDFKKWLIFVMILCWLPMLMNEYYNRVYDFSENFEIMSKSVAEKKMVRLCTMDFNQRLGGFFCGISFFLEKVFKSIDAGASVKLISMSGSDVYMNYPLETKYKLVRTIDEAEYLLFYLSSDQYILEGKALYQIGANGNKDLRGHYEMYQLIGNRMAILKKIKE